MTTAELRVLLDWYMVSDPWPLPGDNSHEIIGELLDRESKKRGHDNWEQAYHYVGGVGL